MLRSWSEKGLDLRPVTFLPLLSSEALTTVARFCVAVALMRPMSFDEQRIGELDELALGGRVGGAVVDDGRTDAAREGVYRAAERRHAGAHERRFGPAMLLEEATDAAEVALLGAPPFPSPSPPPRSWDAHRSQSSLICDALRVHRRRSACSP